MPIMKKVANWYVKNFHKTKNMKAKEKQELLAKLNAALINSDENWKAGEKSHAYIIGCLEGAIKSAIIDIECMKH